MRKLIVFLLVIMPFCLQAQPVTAKTANTDPLYIVDGEPTPTEKVNSILKSSDTSNIYEVSVLKYHDSLSLAKYGQRGVILINTKKFAKLSYQEKFGKFSLEYKNYLEQHNGDDVAITYDLAGLIIKNNYPRKLTDLYQFGADKIKAVRFDERTPDKGPLLTIQMIY